MSYNQDQVYSSGGANDTTGREPFEDSTSTGAGRQYNTADNNEYNTGSNTGYGSGPGNHLQSNTIGNIKAGTSADPAVGHGSHTGDQLLNSGIRRQTGDEYGGIQTGTTSFGTGHDVSQSNEHKSMGQKIKDHFSSGDNSSSTGYNNDSRHSGSGLTGSHSHSAGTGAGIGAAAAGAGVTHSHSHEGYSHSHEGHSHSTGTGAGIGSEIAATGTLGQGTSTATKSTPTGTRNFDEEPIDSTTGQVHHLHTVSGGNTGAEYTTTTSSSTTGAGIGSGLTHGTGVGHEHGHQHSSQYGSNTAANEYERNTSGLTGTSGTGLTGSSGTGTDSSSGYGSTGVGNTGVGGYQGREGAGVTSSGAAGTDKFDVDRSSSGVTGSEYGHNVGDKSSNDHKLSGLTRHGDDFTGGDTADSAYSNPGRTGLTGRENTTTGVQDQHLEGTGAHKEGLLDKVKGMFGGHTNTTHADQK